MIARLKRRTNLSTLYLLCGSSLLLFFIGNVMLLGPGLSEDGHGEDLIRTGQAATHRRQRRGLRDPDVRSRGYARFRRLMENHMDNMQIYFSTVPSTLRQAPYMYDCEDVRNIQNKTYLASGWTKAVYKGILNGRHVAIKTVDIDGHDMAQCKGRAGSVNFHQCYAKSAQKIIKEILLLQGLSHNNVLKVLGFCVPNQPFNGEEETRISLVTELGESIDIIKLLQMTWEDRLRVSLGVTRLVNYLAHSPYGSLSMNDFRRQQFVLVNGELKMTDVDDVGFEEPYCQTEDDCHLYFSSANFTISTTCQNNRCVGFNERKNSFNAARHFTTFLLPHGAPRVFRPVIDDLVNSYSNVTIDSGTLLKKLERIVKLYKNGKYLNRGKDTDLTLKYQQHAMSDLPGQYDYRCRYSLSGGGCTVSVYDLKEAEDLCNTDPDCRGFVVSPQRTWAGRLIIHLKNGISKPSENAATSLHVKPGYSESTKSS